MNRSHLVVAGFALLVGGVFGIALATPAATCLVRHVSRAVNAERVGDAHD